MPHPLVERRLLVIQQFPVRMERLNERDQGYRDRLLVRNPAAEDELVAYGLPNFRTAICPNDLTGVLLIVGPKSRGEVGVKFLKARDPLGRRPFIANLTGFGVLERSRSAEVHREEQTNTIVGGREASVVLSSRRFQASWPSRLQRPKSLQRSHWPHLRGRQP